MYLLFSLFCFCGLCFGCGFVAFGIRCLLVSACLCFASFVLLICGFVGVSLICLLGVSFSYLCLWFYFGDLVLFRCFCLSVFICCWLVLFVLFWFDIWFGWFGGYFCLWLDVACVCL